MQRGECCRLILGRHNFPPTLARTPTRRSLGHLNPTVRNGDVLTRRIVLKVGMVGDAQIGKTSLMVKYVEGSFE